MKRPSLVTAVAQVEANIREYRNECRRNPTFLSRAAYARAWYAIKDEDTGNWLFGPSKFIGYENNTSKNYLATSNVSADGRETEPRLQQWFDLVDEGSTLGRELHAALAAYLGDEVGPNRLARISVRKDVSLSQPRRQCFDFTRISARPDICGGRPCVRDTRVRVSDILDMLANGASETEILADYPYLEAADISTCLAYAARAADHVVLRAA